MMNKQEFGKSMSFINFNERFPLGENLKRSLGYFDIPLLIEQEELIKKEKFHVKKYFSDSDIICVSKKKYDRKFFLIKNVK